MTDLDGLIIDEAFEDARPRQMRRERITVGQMAMVVLVVAAGLLAMLLGLIFQPKRSARDPRSDVE